MNRNKLIFLFIASLVFFLLILSGEIGLRIKYLGFSKMMQSILKHESQSSVLGTGNWVISDSDLDFRLNPAQPGVNSLSMREKEIVTPKPPGVTRIIILGDSLAFLGDPTYVQLLNQLINKETVEVINASTPGYTTYQELLFLEKYVMKVEPDIVILSYCLNDNYKLLHRFDKDANMLWSKEGEESLTTNTTIDAFINKSYLLTTLKMLLIKERINKNTSNFPWESTIDFNIAWKDYAWPDFSDRLDTMNTLLQKNHGKLYVVVFPIEMQLDRELLNTNREMVTKPQKKVADYSMKFGIPYLDLLPVFFENKVNGKELFIDGLHLSPDGKELAAKAIYDFLVKDEYAYTLIK